MDSTTVRLIALLACVCLLAGINVAAAVLGVPVITATIGDAISVIITFGGILIGVKTLPPPPPPPPPTP